MKKIKLIKKLAVVTIAAPLVYIAAYNLTILGTYFAQKPSQLTGMFADYFQDKKKLKDYELKPDGATLNYLDISRQINKALVFGEKEELQKLEEKSKGQKKAFEDRLEQLIECDLTLMLGRKVNLTTELQRTNSVLLMSRRDEIKITNFNPLPYNNPYLYRFLSDYEKLAVEDLAEGLGNNAKKIDVDSDYVQNLAVLYKKDFENPTNQTRQAIKDASNQILIKEFSLSEPQIQQNRATYAAYVAQIGGITLNSPVIQLIGIGDQLGDLRSVVFVYGHEAGHVLFTRNSSFLDTFQNIKGMVIGGEKIIIEETAADLVGEEVTQRFLSQHLKNPKLIEEYNSETIAGGADNSTIVKLAQGYIDRKDFDGLELLVSQVEEWQKTGSKRPHVVFNQAVLALMQRYSGTEQVKKKLEYIRSKISFEKFLETVAKTQSFEELDATYKKLGGKPF